MHPVFLLHGDLPGIGHNREEGLTAVDDEFIRLKFVIYNIHAYGRFIIVLKIKSGFLENIS